jgi:hypothetical protein
MLEQAIVDAAALREAALKNAEQAIIEKYAPQIKEAVDSMLEGDVVENRWSPNQLVQHEGRFARITTEADQGKVGIKYIGEEKTNLVTEAELQEADESLLQEEEGVAMGGGETTTPSAVETIPYAAGINPDGEVSASMNVYDFTPEDFNIDLQDMFLSQDQAEAPVATSPDEEIEVGDDLDLDLSADTDEEAAEETPEAPEEPEAAGEDTDVLFEELISALAEELTVDMGETKQGHFTTDKGTLKYEQEMEMAAGEDSEKKEEDEELVKAREKADKLDEAVRKQTAQIKDLLKIVDELNSSLNETLLSNAKLLYCNKTLSDASLNERQKSKIVEAIAQANTPDEAKTLQETLKATVGTTKKAGPKSLSESVNRKSNLSGIMPRRKQPEQFTFADQMKKLAGIK